MQIRIGEVAQQGKKFANIYRDPYTMAKRHHTLRRLLNLIIIEIQKRLRNSYIFGYPRYLVIEATNYCNLKCPLCPTGQGVKSRAKGKMSLENFKKIIDRLGPYLYSIRLENWGEPLLNEAVYDMISYAHKKKINTSFNTNLTFLDPSDAERLVLSGLNHIKISLDGASTETYSQYRIGGDFERVVGNIKTLVQKKKDLNRRHPFIELQFIVMKHNEQEMDKMRALSKSLGVDSLLIENMRPDMREELFSSDTLSIEKYRKWLPKNEEYSLFDYKGMTRKQKKRFCNYLWTTAVINWDGSVVPCCSVYDEKYDFGNIFAEDFARIWNGPKYRASRAMIRQKKKSKIDTVCINCLKYGIIA